MSLIHPTAVVDPAAKVADDVKIGAYAVVGPHVELQAGVELRPHCHVRGHTRVGERTRIFPFSVVGEEPQDKGFDPETETELRIGSDNVIREHVSIHLGTPEGNGCTTIGDDNLFMNGSHVGHDSEIGDHVIVASNVALGGHCEVQDFAVIGGLCGVHQFARVGESVMVAGLAGVAQDAPPFSLVAGERTTIRGINAVGIRRRGFSPAVRREIKRAYHIVFHSKLRLEVALDQIKEEGLASDEVARLVHFLETSERGFSRP
ncbi:MAG: acyl-ACP--UDP-N-acetylglucosamine O-acyltransferase [Myxococcota bacterium]